MSASPVSVAADPTTASRRRHVGIDQKKSGLDLAGSDTIAASPVAGGDHSRGKDLSRSRTVAETVLERSTDARQIKGHLPTNSGTTLPRRATAKKGGASSSSSSSKPLWKTILNVFGKNFVLLLVLLLLLQMFHRLAFNQRDGSDALLVTSSDYERRIAEMEAFLKTTTKMVQVQVDVVDRKIENEIAGLKTELSKRIDDNGAGFSSRLQELDGRVKSMEKSLTASPEWLSKDEFDRFMEEFKELKGFDDYGDLKLDELRAFAKEVVEKEIEKHAADGLGRDDYAVASGGAMVLEHSEPFSGVVKVNWFNRNRVHSDAVKMLQPSFGEPGQCFPLRGNSGFVQIKLRTAIIPVAITLEHVAKSVAFDRSSAPKDCRVFGLLRNKDMVQMQLLTEFVYDLEKSSAQTFNVLDTGGSSVIDTIRLDFTSNHGSPTHTCIYRLRVHGNEPKSLSSLALQS